MGDLEGVVALGQHDFPQYGLERRPNLDELIDRTGRGGVPQGWNCGKEDEVEDVEVGAVCDLVNELDEPVISCARLGDIRNAVGIVRRGVVLLDPDGLLPSASRSIPLKRLFLYRSLVTSTHLFRCASRCSVKGKLRIFSLNLRYATGSNLGRPTTIRNTTFVK